MALDSRVLKMVSQAKGKYSGMSSKSIKPKEGRNTYRILAPNADWVEAAGGQFWADLGVHWIKADPNGKPIAVVGDCDTVYQKPSILNSAIEMAIESAPDEATKELYSSWKARRSVLINVIDRQDKGNTDPQILELTATTFGKVLDIIQLYGEAGEDITDPVSGVDIVITRTGKGLNTNYDVAVAPGKSAPVPKDVLDKSADLPKHIGENFFRGEEQKALNAIQEISGVALPRIGSSASRTPTPALTSASASVEDADMPFEPDAPKAVKTAAPVEAPAEDPLAAKRAEIARRRAAAEADAEAELAALEADTPPAAETSTSDADAILAELDGLM